MKHRYRPARSVTFNARCNVNYTVNDIPRALIYAHQANVNLCNPRYDNSGINLSYFKFCLSTLEKFLYGFSVVHSRMIDNGVHVSITNKLRHILDCTFSETVRQFVDSVEREHIVIDDICKFVDQIPHGINVHVYNDKFEIEPSSSLFNGLLMSPPVDTSYYSEFTRMNIKRKADELALSTGYNLVFDENSGNTNVDIEVVEDVFI